MSGCRINRNKNISRPVNDTCEKEVADRLAKMIEERKRQDLSLENVITEAEYNIKYGKGPDSLEKK